MFGWLKGKKETKSAAARTSARPSRVQTSPGHRVQSPSTSPSGVQTSPGRRIERPTPVRSPAIPEADLEQGRATLLGEVDTVIEGMPLLSGAARETYEASLDPEAEIAKIEAMLQHDASLTANLLRIANSAHYRGANPVMTIPAALGRVGLRGLRDMLMVVAAGRVLRIPGHPEVTEHLLARGPAVAYTSRRVAEALGVNGDACFTAGLLHDIGLPVAYLAAARSRNALPATIREGGPEGLLELARHTHQAIGQRVGLRWNLAPATLCAIGNHHDPASGPTKGRKAAWVVAVALALVDSVGWYPEEDVSDILSHPMIRKVGLTPAQTAKLTNTLREELELHAPAA